MFELDELLPVLRDRRVLAIAADRGFESIAFPCISTGAYEFPKELACEIALETVSNWLTIHDFPKQVTFCCFDESDADLDRNRLAGRTG
jgi:O-acetyl-ADP-ribose deacetylase (regulator of RNase III)